MSNHYLLKLQQFVHLKPKKVITITVEEDSHNNVLNELFMLLALLVLLLILSSHCNVVNMTYIRWPMQCEMILLTEGIVFYDSGHVSAFGNTTIVERLERTGHMTFEIT